MSTASNVTSDTSDVISRHVGLAHSSRKIQRDWGTTAFAVGCVALVALITVAALSGTHHLGVSSSLCNHLITPLSVSLSISCAGGLIYLASKKKTPKDTSLPSPSAVSERSSSIYEEGVYRTDSDNDSATDPANPIPPNRSVNEETRPVDDDSNSANPIPPNRSVNEETRPVDDDSNSVRNSRHSSFDGEFHKEWAPPADYSDSETERI